jgi:hypothetical protein
MRFSAPWLAGLVAFVAAVSPLWASDAVVLCTVEGDCHQKLPQENDRAANDIDHAWIWSDRCPVRRVNGAGLEAAIQSLQAPGCGQQSHRATFTIAKRGTARESVDVIAAPVAMWQEVDEVLLPRFTVPPKEHAIAIPVVMGVSWRARATAPSGGSWWCTDPSGKGCALVLLETHSRTLTVVGPHGQPIDSVSVSVMEDVQGRRHADVLAIRRSSTKGVVDLSSIPDTERLVCILNHDGFAPAVVKGLPSELPSSVTLAAGRTVTGRIVRKGKGGRYVVVSGASVAFESWIPGSTAVFSKDRKSGSNGEFRLESLPAAAGVLIVQHTGAAVLKHELNLKEGDAGVGELRLTPASTLRARVTDERGVALSRIRVHTGPFRGETDDRGFVTVDGLGPDDAVVFDVSGPGIVGTSLHVNAPFPKILDLRVERSHQISGTFVDSQGNPVSGDVLLRAGSFETFQQVGSDGRLEVDAPPEKALELSFTSTVAAPWRRNLEAGAAGIVNNLGRIVLPIGAAVHGTVLTTAGEPVLGARIWTTRPASQGPLVAWMRGELVATRSTETGEFFLRGIDSVPAVLRVDAPGFARSYVAPTPNSEAVTEVGTVALSRGATVHVTSREAREGMIARIDLRGEGLDLDVLEEPLAGGDALLKHVPAGTSLLQVRSGRVVVCEKTFVVGGEGEQQSIDCTTQPMRVNGRVTSGGRSAEGIVTWRNATSPPIHAAILNRRSPAGLLQQDTYGSPEEVTVVLAADGTFTSDELRPGEWTVNWISPQGPAPVRRVVLPELESAQVSLDYPTGSIEGSVADMDGRPAKGAVVHEVSGASFTRVASDGTFRIEALSAGTHALVADRDSEHSESLNVPVDPDRPVTGVTLRLGRSEEPVEVSVIAADGTPAANALVFSQSTSGALAVTTADAAGHVKITPEARTTQMRFAAWDGHTWLFDGWRETDALLRGVKLQMPRDSGSLGLISEFDDDRDLSIHDAGGWDITAVLQRVGIPRRMPARSRRTISGLPAGATYFLTLGSATRSESTRAGATIDVVFR